MTSINKREMTASISVPSRSTIVLGGLVQTDFQNAKTHVPILGSIPILGALFRSEDTTRHRTELLVLITPYVLISPKRRAPKPRVCTAPRMSPRKIGIAAGPTAHWRPFRPPSFGK